MINLYLLRHGEAAAMAPTDSQRPLTEHGRQQVAVSAGLLPQLDLMVASPYLRAQQSAQIVAETVAIAKQSTSETITPDSSPSDVVAWLETVDAESILLVTHNPFVSQIASWLTGDLGIGFRTGTLAHLQGDFVGPNCMTLKSLS